MRFVADLVLQGLVILVAGKVPMCCKDDVLDVEWLIQKVVGVDFVVNFLRDD